MSNNTSLPNVINPDYDIFNSNNFLGGTDPIRIVINIYIILSLIFNCINYAVILITRVKNNIQLLLGNWLLLGVLFMNFIHTATYAYQWVIKEGVNIVTRDVPNIFGDKTEVKIGALLNGNPKRMSTCYLQGFFLIFSSISQDFIINIFFYLMDSSEVNNFYVKLAIIILGLLIPFFLTLILFLLGGIGLNDEFCYVKKFHVIVNEAKNEVDYSYFLYFQPYVMAVYFVRIINCIATTYFLHKIFRFAKSENRSFFYLLKLLFIPIIQVITITIGVIYRFANIFSPGSSANLSAAYLIINTSDGFLFPIGFALQNGIFTQLKILIFGKKKEEEKETPKQLEIMDKVFDDLDTP